MAERLIEGKIPGIISVGKAVPPNIISNEDIDSLLGRTKGLTDRAMRRTGTGIMRRHWVTYENNTVKEATSDLGAEALLQAIEMSGTDKNKFRRIVFATSSSDYMGVPAAAMVQHKLGLPTNIQYFDVAAACTGFVHGLKETFVNLESPAGDGGPQAVIACEIISPTLSKHRGNTFILFGDGAGAVVVDLVKPDEGAPTNRAFVAGADGSLAEKLNVPAGGSKYPASQYTIDNDMHSMYMEGEIIHDNAIIRMAEVSKKALEKAGVPMEDVALFIPHQANLSIIQSTAESLNFPMDRVMVTVNKYGNTSAAAIPMALREAWDTDRIKRNDIMVVATFGAGLEFAAAVLPMVGLPKKK